MKTLIASFLMVCVYLNGAIIDEEYTPPDKPLTINENLHGGRVLRLNDNSMWEVAPEDVNYTSLWITPFPIEVTKDGEGEYPYRITNKISGTSVKVRQVDTENPDDLPPVRDATPDEPSFQSGPEGSYQYPETPSYPEFPQTPDVPQQPDYPQSPDMPYGDGTPDVPAQPEPDAPDRYPANPFSN